MYRLELDVPNRRDNCAISRTATVGPLYIATEVRSNIHVAAPALV